MTTDHVWIGGAPAAAQVDTVTLPDDIVAGLVWNATIAGVTLSYTIPADTSNIEAAAEIVDLWNASDFPQIAEITADDNGDGSFTLNASEAGKSFIVTVLFGDGTNEVQVVTIGGNPTGGTFVLSSGGETTDPISHDATAETVEAELEALDAIGAGNVAVTGDPGGSYTVEFIGDLAGVNMDPLGANADGLTVPPEIQVIDLGSPTGGTWTIQLGADGDPTTALDYDITAADLKTALEALDEIGADDVAVAGDPGGPFTVTFQGEFNAVDVESLIVDGANLTGGLADDVSIVETTAGGGGSSGQWSVRAIGTGTEGRISIDGNANVNGGTFDFGIITGYGAMTRLLLEDVPYDVTIRELQTLLDDYLGTATESRIKQYDLFGPAPYHYKDDRKLSEGALFFMWVPLVFGDIGADGVSVYIDDTNLTHSSGSAGYSAGWAAYSGYATEGDPGYGDGDWVIRVNGQESAALDQSLSAADLVTVLEDMAAIGAGNVAVDKIGAGLDEGGGYRISFIGDLANNYNSITITADGVSGSGHAIRSTKKWRGDAGTVEVQTISISGSPGSGQFGIEFDGEYSAVIAYNQTASELEAILEAMPSIGAGGVSCSGGPFPDTPIVVTFSGGLSGSDLDLLEAVQGTSSTTQDGGNPASMTVETTQVPLTHETTTVSQGPNDWNTAANWDTGTVPGDTDNVFIVDGADIYYGLDQSGVALNRLEIHNRAGAIGLPRWSDDYYEYRPRFLKLNVSEIIIGLGEGSGSNRINLDIGDTDPTIEIHDSGAGVNGESAIQIIGVNAENTAELLMLGGEVGVATFPKQEAYFSKITLRDGELTTGMNVFIAELTSTGGTFQSDRTTVGGTTTL